MQGFRFRLASATVRHRWLTMLLIGLVTAFFAAGLPKVELRTIFSDLFQKNHPFVQTNRMTRLEQVREISGGYKMRVNEQGIFNRFLTVSALRRLGD